MKVFNKINLVLGIFLLIFLVTSCTVTSPPVLGDTICIRDTCFMVEIAKNSLTREQGLMSREYLAEDEGMLFIFPKVDKYSFWMKNTVLPLDILWIDHTKKIVFISYNTSPCTADPCPLIVPPISVPYVLEIAGGRAQKLGITEGDTATFSLSPSVFQGIE